MRYLKERATIWFLFPCHVPVMKSCHVWHIVILVSRTQDNTPTLCSHTNTHMTLANTNTNTPLPPGHFLPVQHSTSWQNFGINGVEYWWSCLYFNKGTKYIKQLSARSSHYIKDLLINKKKSRVTCWLVIWLMDCKEDIPMMWKDEEDLGSDCYKYFQISTDQIQIWLNFNVTTWSSRNWKSGKRWWSFFLYLGDCQCADEMSWNCLTRFLAGG